MEGSAEEPGRPCRVGAQATNARWECITVVRPGRESERPILCAEQRVDREGSSPSGARMRSAVSERGGNASRAGREEGMEKPKRARRRKPDTAKADLELPLAIPGGQGVRREVESEGHEEKYRAVIDGGYPEDELVGQRWGKVEPAL